MHKISLLTLLFPFSVGAQHINYTPNRKLDKTVAANYYNTEFIYLNNIADESISLSFEQIENTLLTEWSATICTNMTCYSNLPKSGNLGQLAPADQAYISFNFSANKTLGEGRVRFLITSPDEPLLSDTVTFNYTVTENGTVVAGPWANLNFSQGVLTVLLENPNLKPDINVFNLEGKSLYSAQLEPITSIPIRDFQAGMYLVFIRDEYNRVIRHKIIHYGT